MMTQLRKDEAALSKWQQLCSLPPRCGKNTKKRLFLFSFVDALAKDMQPFGPSFWRETQEILGEEQRGSLTQLKGKLGSICFWICPSERTFNSPKNIDHPLTNGLNLFLA